MCYWRQWRKPITKMKNLLKRGVLLALSCGATRKGVWRGAKTKGINRSLSNIYLVNAGLLSLKDIWIKIHHGQ
ncbi:MAG: RNA-directed DNA polymerase [Alteromonadaceae bacterium]|jgi:RNA-directed DNA polymerase